MAKEESSVGPIAAIFGSAFLPIIIAVILFFALQGQANGASTPEPIDPAPGSAQSAALSNLGCDTNPTLCIKQNSTQLTDIQNQLQTLLTSVNNSTAPYQSMSNKAAVATAITTGLSEVKTLEQNTNNASKFQSQATTLGTQLGSIDQLLMAGIDGNTSAALVQWAKATVDYNENGSGPITYAQLQNYPIVDGFPQQVDCSGFVSWVMYKAGILKGWEGRPPTTSTLLNYAENGTLGFTFVPGFTLNTGADYDSQISAAIASGVIKPGDILFSGEPDADNRHVVMYIGGSDPTEAIAESTTIGSKNGPQYSSVAERTTDDHIVRAVIQPPGV